MSVQSMTGFARSEASWNGARFVWEIRSVNGKGLDVRLRLPPGFESLEMSARKLVADAFTRGNLQVSLQTGEGGQPAWKDIEVERLRPDLLPSVEVLASTDRIGQLYRDLGCTHRGVLITRSLTDMPAHASGLRNGDLITSIDGRDIANVRQLQSTISSIRPGKSVRVVAWRYDGSIDSGTLINFNVSLARREQ